jgi:hypothetical protein
MSNRFTYPRFIEQTITNYNNSKCIITDWENWRVFHQKCLERDLSEKETNYHLMRLKEYDEKIEKEKPYFESLHNLIPDVSGNGNNLAAAYIQALKTNNTCLSLSIKGCCFPIIYSMTEVPDLSQMTELEELDLSGHEALAIGLERIPTSLKRLTMCNTNIQDATFLKQLVNLQILDLKENYRIVELPDLSSFNKLEVIYIQETSIHQIPNLPPKLVSISFPPKMKGLFYQSEIDSIMPKYSLHQNYITINIYSGKYQISMHEFIYRVARINQFHIIRKELFEKAAHITLNPARIARLLEAGIDFDELEDRDNVF